MKLYRSTVVIVAALFDLASAELATAQIGDVCVKQLSGIGTDTLDPGCGVDGPIQGFVFQSQKPGPLVVYLDEPSIDDGMRTYAQLFGPFDTAAEACNGYNGEDSIGFNTDPCDGLEDTSCLSLGLTYKDNEEGKFYGLLVGNYVFNAQSGTEFPDCSGGSFIPSPDFVPVIRQTKVTFIYLDSEGEDKCGKASKGTKTDSTKTSKTTKAPKRIR